MSRAQSAGQLLYRGRRMYAVHLPRANVERWCATRPGPRRLPAETGRRKTCYSTGAVGGLRGAARCRARAQLRARLRRHRTQRESVPGKRLLSPRAAAWPLPRAIRGAAANSLNAAASLVANGAAIPILYSEYPHKLFSTTAASARKSIASVEVCRFTPCVSLQNCVLLCCMYQVAT